MSENDGDVRPRTRDPERARNLLDSAFTPGTKNLFGGDRMAQAIGSGRR